MVKNPSDGLRRELDLLSESGYGFLDHFSDESSRFRLLMEQARGDKVAFYAKTEPGTTVLCSSLSRKMSNYEEEDFPEGSCLADVIASNFSLDIERDSDEFSFSVPRQ